MIAFCKVLVLNTEDWTLVELFPLLVTPLKNNAVSRKFVKNLFISENVPMKYWLQAV